jgi:hypothetical protein
MLTKIKVCWLLIPLLWLSACSQGGELPTRVSTAVVPDQVLATSRPLPPTSTPTIPVFTPPPSATPVVPTIESTSVAGPGVNITSPNDGTQLSQGQVVTTGGFVQLGASDTLSVMLVTPTNHLISEAEVQLNDFNSWQANLNVPHHTSGTAELVAFVMDEEGTVLARDEKPVQLLVNREGNDRYLELFRPVTGEVAVAGYNLFFDGITELPADNLVTISIWNESCQVEVAKQSFRLRGSGYWQGFIVVPRDVTGPVCAVAHFGSPGEDNWRETQVLLEILPAEDPTALDVHIGNPPPDSLLIPGKPLLLYGTAYNAPDKIVTVSILLENGRLLTEGVAEVNDFGYWELELFIPDEIDGLAQIEASIGQRDSDEFAQHETKVNIGTVQ